MPSTTWLVAVGAVGLMVLACSSDTTGASPSSSSSCTPNTGDGTSACGEVVCQAGAYCESSVLDECLNGCKATNNCPSGQYCDLTNPNQEGVGTCRACTPSTSSSSSGGGGGACGDYAGTYTFTSAAGSASQCTDLTSEFLGSGAECSFAQTQCAMVQSCGQSGKIEFSLDASNKGKSTTNVSSSEGSASVVCSYTFSGEGTGKSLTMNCQITGPGGVLTCNYNGALN